MLKRIFTLLLIGFAGLAKAQYTANVVGDNSVVYIYVGTLSMATDNSSNFEKLKVDVFGGAWESDATGETTYYISNRGGLNINQVTIGSSANNCFTLKAYQNGSGTNFYLVTNGVRYKALSVKAFLLGANNTPSQTISITTSTTAPANPIAVNVVPVMYTDGVGNIGINTATPDAGYRLSVNGNIRAKAIKVESGWADFVFDKGYRLRTLSEVSKFIDDHHHLPDVPSAKEVEQNGLNLGESNVVLLRKIEELTLYLIETQKQLKAQQSVIRDLKKTVKGLKRLETRH